MNRTIVKEMRLYLAAEFYTGDRIVKILRKVEREEGFAGFVELHFEQDELPIIKYYSIIGEKDISRDN